MMEQGDGSVPAQLEARERAALYAAHLVAASLRGEAACPLPEGVPWGQVWAVVAANSVEAMSYPAVAALDAPEQVRCVWAQAADETLYRRLRFDVEREEVFAALAARGVSCLPFKGAVVQACYPQPGMRSMSDNDFLYGFVEPDPEGRGWRIAGATPVARAESAKRAQEVLVEVMEARGYETASVGVGNHESFHKAPFNFEPHRRLVHEGTREAAYYENPWARAVQSAHDPHLFSFAPEDEYLYLIVHAKKHYDGAGCGFRFAVDLRVFLDAHVRCFDWEYVRRELDALGAADFEERSRALADAAFSSSAWFAARSLPERERAWLAELAGNGVYGSFERRVANRLASLQEEGSGPAAARLRYAARRFADPDALAARFPRASRCAPLRPALYAVRLIGGAVRRPRRLLREISVLLRR